MRRHTFLTRPGYRRNPDVPGRLRSALLGLLFIAALPFSTYAQSYCTANGGNGNAVNIARVVLGPIDNVSGDDNGYGDFTALVVDAAPGASLSMTLDPTGPWWVKYRWRVWLDANADGDFNDPGELVLQEKGYGTRTAQIMVPTNAVPGTTRLRIAMKAGSYVGPCAHYSYGEVEDYSVNILGDCEADAGTLTAGSDALCLDGTVTLTATPNGDANVPAGYSTVYVLTEGPGLVIQNAGPNPSFDVTMGGNYTIHTLVYDPNTLDLSIVVPGVTTGFDVNGLLIQGGGSICASLDVAGAPIAVNAPDAGTLTAFKDNECLGGGVQIGATPNGDANVPAGYNTIYVLTEGADLVIQNAGPDPLFNITTPGDYTIHTLVYDPNTLDLSIVVPGVTTGFDVNSLLVQGGGSICAALDVAGAPTTVSDPDAGTLTAGSDALCLDGTVTLTATPNGDANVPAGYSTVYVLTEGPGLVIQNAGPNPSFDVTMGGNYTIHTLVYDPNTLDLSIVVPGVTTGFDVNGLLIQGGGSICASLDVAGAPIAVEDPQAGTLTADAEVVCLVNGTAAISATPNGDVLVPNGYSTVYVLTEGNGLVIQNAGPVPSFDVTMDGNYTIHTLVYDPNTLDLSIVVPGVTTGFDVNGLLVQGGGGICASLDVAGAPIQVDANNPDCVCLADAGTLTAWKDDECLSGGSVTIGATPNGDANVPAGYSTVFVLTEGPGLVIQNAGPNPSFDVTMGGNYTIHTLVYDPNTLDLSIVVPGVTTGFDVNGLLIQGGGGICASLDVAGAPVQVNAPNAGSIHPANFITCLSDGSAVISANPGNNANVPAGYSTVYVLTRGQGLVIQNAGPDPVFTVTQSGLYRIHTLVYDPNTLDLSIVVPGVTTGFDVNSLLVQGGGNICASLDVSGAPFLVLHGWICNWFFNNHRDNAQDPLVQLSATFGKTPETMTDADLKDLTAPTPVSTTIYPVPARDVLFVDLNTMVESTVEISLMDMTGRMVQAVNTYALEPGTRTLTFNVNALQPGQYFLRMTTIGGTFNERFVVTK